MLSITELRGKNLSMFLCGGSDIIPMKFHKYSGVRDYQFRICNSGFYRNLHDMPGWPCTIYKDTHWEEVYLPLSEFPHEIEALSILSTLDDETEREGRYINVHAAYEAVVLIRETDYSAIRHLLAHPVVRLTRPNVRESLERRFGSIGLNLRDYQHQKEFYRCIGQMLIAVEKTIHETVMSKWDRVIRKNLTTE